MGSLGESKTKRGSMGDSKMKKSHYRIVSNKCPGGVASFSKGGMFYKRQVFNAKMQWLSLFTMTRRREI